jgi:hypothetical protein
MQNKHLIQTNAKVSFSRSGAVSYRPGSTLIDPGIATVLLGDHFHSTARHSAGLFPTVLSHLRTLGENLIY